MINIDDPRVDALYKKMKKDGEFSNTPKSSSLNIDDPRVDALYKKMKKDGEFKHIDNSTKKENSYRKAANLTKNFGFPYAGAMSQAVMESLLSVGRFLSRPFSKEVSDEINKKNKEIQNNFEEDNEDNPDQLMAKETFKFLTLLALPGGKVTGATKAAKIGNFILKNAGLGALYGGMLANPNQNLSQAMGVGAIAAPVLGGALAAGFSLPKAFLKMVGSAKPEQIMQNLKKMEGNPILGSEILESNTLKRLQLWLKDFMNSGQAKRMKEINNNLKEKSSSLLSEITDGIETDTPEADLENLFSEKANQIIDTKNNLFDNFEKIAKGLNFDISSASKEAKLRLNDIKKYVENYNFNNKDKNNLIKVLNVIATKKGIQEGDDSIKFAKFAAKELDDLARQSTDTYVRNQLRGVSNEIRNSINESVEKNGTKKQKETWNIANNFYKNEYSKLLDPDIERLILKDGEINPYMLFKKFAGKKITQDPFMLNKILGITGNDGKNLILSDFFKGGDEDPFMMVSKYRQMPKETKEKLLTKNQIEKFDKLEEQAKLSSTAMEKVLNLPTGHNVAPQQAQMASFLATGVALNGALKLMLGNPAGAKELFLGMSALSSAPLMAKLLDSPLVLHAIAKSALGSSIEKAGSKNMAPAIDMINNLSGDSDDN